MEKLDHSPPNSPSIAVRHGSSGTIPLIPRRPKHQPSPRLKIPRRDPLGRLPPPRSHRIPPLGRRRHDPRRDGSRSQPPKPQNRPAPHLEPAIIHEWVPMDIHGLSIVTILKKNHGFFGPTFMD